MNQDKWEKEIKPLLYPYMDTDDYEVAIAFIKRLLTSQKERMGNEFVKWFYGTNDELIEDAIERITGVKCEPKETI